MKSDKNRTPFYFHNGGKYDCKFILEHLALRPDYFKRPKVIGKTKESFLSIDVGAIIFRDSLNHLPAALETLSQTLRKKTEKNLTKSGWKAAFQAYKRSFPSLYKYFERNYMRIVGPENFEKIIRKGIFPYTYFTGSEVFADRELPDRKYFFNDLQQKELPEEDYQKAQELWRLFQIENFGEYHDLYLFR